jgi:hypothetical protein
MLVVLFSIAHQREYFPINILWVERKGNFFFQPRLTRLRGQ